ncbi:MAG: hypothetical protein O3A02_03455 [bacterium]|nr:hypothetical protein [bacterium]
MGEGAATTPLADAEDFLRARPQTSFLPLAGAKLPPNEERADAFNEGVTALLGRIGWRRRVSPVAARRPARRLRSRRSAGDAVPEPLSGCAVG